MKAVLVIGNNYTYDEKDFIDSYVIGVDKGALYCLKNHIKMDLAVGDFDSVNNSEYELIKENEKNLFDSELKNIELIMSQQFFCEKLPEIEYFTHGDYFIGESK